MRIITLGEILEHSKLILSYKNFTSNSILSKLNATNNFCKYLIFVNYTCINLSEINILDGIVKMVYFSSSIRIFGGK